MLDKEPGRQDVLDSSRVHEFLRMNLPEFTRSAVNGDLEHYIDEFVKVFQVMKVSDIEQVELATY